MTTMTDYVAYCPRICFRLFAIIIHLVLFKKACEIKEILFNGLKLKKLASGARCLFLISGCKIQDVISGRTILNGSVSNWVQ